MSEPEHDRAYRTLDGLRGVAALLVVTRHAGHFFPGGLFPESFLAVDLFFLLSGFVIAYAYEARLLAGRSLASFMKTRLIRLYPLYLLGLVVGLAARMTAAGANGDAWDPLGLAQAMAVGLFMLPAAPLLPMGPLDGPTWTLAPELAVNLIYAKAVKRLSNRVLIGIVALGAAGLVASEYIYGSLDGGWTTAAFPLLVARLTFSFFLGVLMFRYRPRRRRAPIAAWACLAVLALALTLRPPQGARHLYELSAAMLAFPAIVAVALRSEPGRHGGAVFAVLGAVSYAVYVLHHPLGNLAGTLLDSVDDLNLPAPLLGALFMLGVVAAGALADKLYDAPLRRWLSGLRRARPPVLQPELRPGEA